MSYMIFISPIYDDNHSPSKGSIIPCIRNSTNINQLILKFMSSLNFQNILVPVDFSETSFCAVEHAVFLANKNNAKITLIHVMEPAARPATKFAFSMYNMGEYEEKIENLEQKQVEFELRKETLVREELSKLEASLMKKGIDVGISIIEKGKVYKMVCAAAEKMETDLIIMGTHGASGFREFMVGSNTYKVVTDAKCPVLSVKQETKTPGFKNIFLPFIDKPHMREHVDYAIKLAKIYDATIHVLGLDTDKEVDHFKKVRVETDQIVKMAEKNGIKCTADVFPAYYSDDLLIKYGKEKKADLIVIMADINRIGLLQFLTGPIAQQIVNHSSIPVLSIPPVFNPKVASHVPLF
jgi:nucleotide-binding universal stress UspA family protein